MSRYERLGLVEFGRLLLTSGDLDPVYVVLNSLGMSPAQRNRWLTAYCAFYHCGVACWMSKFTADSFWDIMAVAARNEQKCPVDGRWPRAKERRHFRGQQAVLAVAEWRSRWPYPEDMFSYLRGEIGADRMPQSACLVESFDAVRQRALEHRSIGSWLSFKVVDLVDACCGVEVDQSDITPFLYDTPKQVMLRYWREAQGLPETARPRDERAVLEGVNDFLRHKLEGCTLPHKPSKPVDNFALETIWCKYGSHLNGHYPPLNDIREIGEGLVPWARFCPTAHAFSHQLRAMTS